MWVRKRLAFTENRKSRGTVLAHSRKVFSSAEPIKGIVDFDSVKFPRMPSQHFSRGKPWRIKIADPLLVMPA
jgi:hypothetical protein